MCRALILDYWCLHYALFMLHLNAQTRPTQRKPNTHPPTQSINLSINQSPFTPCDYDNPTPSYTQNPHFHGVCAFAYFNLLFEFQFLVLLVKFFRWLLVWFWCRFSFNFKTLSNIWVALKFRCLAYTLYTSLQNTPQNTIILFTIPMQSTDGAANHH